MQQVRNAVLLRHNEILLFSHGPGWSDSPAARKYSSLMQLDALQALKERKAKKKAQKKISVASASTPGASKDGKDPECFDRVSEVICEKETMVVASDGEKG